MFFNIIKCILIFCILTFLLSSDRAVADNFSDGVKAYQSGNYYTAEGCFRRALNAEPYDDAIKYYLAITLVQNKKNNEAKALYKSIITNNSNHDIVSLAQQGLKLLGDGTGRVSNVSKAILNVNTAGNLLLINNVNLNDRVKVQFIFDTGATYTTISSSIARNLGISTANAPKMKIMTGSGYIDAPKITLSKIEINGLAAYNVEALVTDLPVHTSGNAGNLAGLLGLSYMQNFKYTVDKAHNQIILEK